MLYLYNGKIMVVDPMLFWVEWAFLGAFHPSTSSTPLTSALGAQNKMPWGHDNNRPLVVWVQNACFEAPLACLGPWTSSLFFINNRTRWFGLYDSSQHGPMTKWNGPNHKNILRPTPSLNQNS